MLQQLSEFSRARKAEARGALLGHYGLMIGGMLLAAAASFVLLELSFAVFAVGGAAGIVLDSLASVLISAFAGLFQYGVSYVSLAAFFGGQVSGADLLRGFRRGEADRVIRIELLPAAVSVLCGLPGEILGLHLGKAQAGSLLYWGMTGLGILASLIISLLFSMAPYLLIDFPDMGAAEALRMSVRMTRRNMGKLLYLTFSFVPLFLLGLLSCGIADLWVAAYRRGAMAAAYCAFAGKETGQNA